ncbi:MAG: DNA repair exonuclease [Polyangiaceae bacterium]|nr:DNA repair exonuclease [Polyangiaceae bacterium]
MKLVHAADLHVDSPLVGLERYEGAPTERIRQASRRALENLVALCLAERASLLLLAGDVFDGDWRDYATGLFFARQMKLLGEAGVQVVMVRGNHDAASHMSRALELPSNVHELASRSPETRIFDELGVAVHGQSFPGRSVEQDLTARYPLPTPGLFNIGLLHTSLDGREGHDSYAPTTSATLASKGYDYWALGHVHAREVVAQDPWIVFPGNLQGRHVREAGPRGATLVEVDAGRVVAVEARTLDVVRFAVASVDLGAVDMASGHDFVDVARARLADAHVAAEGRLCVVRIVAKGAGRAHAALGGDPERWEAELRRAANELDGVWLERLVVRSTLPGSAADFALRPDVVGQLLRALGEARADPARLAELFDDFAELRRKLPAELRERGFRLDAPEHLVEPLGDVEGLLLSRLLGPGGEG